MLILMSVDILYSTPTLINIALSHYVCIKKKLRHGALFLRVNVVHPSRGTKINYATSLCQDRWHE